MNECTIFFSAVRKLGCLRGAFVGINHNLFHVCVCSKCTCTIKQLIPQQNAQAKAKLSVDALEVLIQPEKIGHPYGMQVIAVPC